VTEDARDQLRRLADLFTNGLDAFMYREAICSVALSHKGGCDCDVCQVAAEIGAEAEPFGEEA
jgi:hypothetical protein